ncbi:MAG: hypothetical protein Kow0047_29220 [Anaerolineae bacterium]
MSAIIMAIMRVFWPRRLRAYTLGRYPNCWTAWSTLRRVSSPMGMAVGVRFRTRDTVLCETPASWATSRMVTDVE